MKKAFFFFALVLIAASPAVPIFSRTAFAIPTPGTTCSMLCVPTAQVGGPLGIGSDDGFWQVLAKAMGRSFVNAFFQQMTRWMIAGIRDGRLSGQPQFITQPGPFLAGVADEGIGRALDVYLGPNAALLCSPFRANVLIGLMSFRQEAPPSCTLSKIFSNMDALLQNWNNGGWGSFLTLSTVTDNAIGSLLVRWDGILSMAAKKTNDLTISMNLNKGFLVSKCVEEDIDPATGNVVCTRETQLTPGAAFDALVQENSTYNLKWMNLETNINNLIAAAAWAVVTYRVMPAFQSNGLFGSATFTIPQEDFSAYTQTSLASQTLGALNTLISGETAFSAAKHNSLAVIPPIGENLTDLETCNTEDNSAEKSALDAQHTQIQTDAASADTLVAQARTLSTGVSGRTTTGADATALSLELTDLQSQAHDPLAQQAAQTEYTSFANRNAALITQLSIVCPGITASTTPIL